MRLICFVEDGLSKYVGVDDSVRTDLLVKAYHERLKELGVGEAQLPFSTFAPLYLGSLMRELTLEGIDPSLPKPDEPEIEPEAVVVSEAGVKEPEEVASVVAVEIDLPFTETPKKKKK